MNRQQSDHNGVYMGQGSHAPRILAGRAWTSVDSTLHTLKCRDSADIWCINPRLPKNRASEVLYLRSNNCNQFLAMLHVSP